MKKILIIVLLSGVFTSVSAQVPEVSHDANGNKILKGFIQKQELVSDTAFTWFVKNQEGYVPEQNALNALRGHKDSINMIVFGGTWCGDTKNILPKFYKLTDAAGFSNDRITLIGVDHSKKTIQHLSEAFDIINVPTIIVMKNGKEIGRVVEYGHFGMFDKELGEIIGGKMK